MMRRRRDERSDEAAQYRSLYKSGEWQRLRARQLMAYPLCARCYEFGRVSAATVVHHKREHKGDVRLFFNATNLQSLCKPCHDGPVQQRERTGHAFEIGLDGHPVG